MQGVVIEIKMQWHEKDGDFPFKKEKKKERERERGWNVCNMGWNRLMERRKDGWMVATSNRDQQGNKKGMKQQSEKYIDGDVKGRERDEHVPELD